MTLYHNILAFDPSGDFTKGQGQTGICIFHTEYNTYESRTIKASEFTKAEDYWAAHTQLINLSRAAYQDDLIIVTEDFMLYGNKAMQQIGSRFETVKLIGIMQQLAYELGTEFYLQRANIVKSRWTDEILEYKGYLWRKPDTKFWYHYDRATIMNDHQRDALRHAVHYVKFINGKEKIC